jgi:ribose-phosphate pyrophosphokinase
MEKVVFILPGNEQFSTSLKGNVRGELEVRNFPDGESYARILTSVKGRHVVFICSLNQPDSKIIQLYFLSKIATELGASKITLVAPYLAYMRQDAAFSKGEGVTARYIAELLSKFVDEIVTIDPHLHRIRTLDDVFRSPTVVLHAADKIADWIKANVKNPVVLGPDSESIQWVSAVAQKANARFEVLEKKRTGDRQVEVSVPQIKQLEGCTLVLVDDIISTGRTMIKTLLQVKNSSSNTPVCITIHPVFSGSAYKDLLDTGARVISCNTIAHESNTIDLSDLLYPL